MILPAYKNHVFRQSGAPEHLDNPAPRQIPLTELADRLFTGPQENQALVNESRTE